MIKLILALSFVLSSSLAFAQTKYLKTYKDQRRIGYDQCQDNHKIILKTYLDQYDSQIARLIVGIDIEESAKAPKIRMNAYYNLLTGLVVKRIITEEMINQLVAFNFDQYKTTEGLRKNVFNTDKIKVNVADRAGKALETALDKYQQHVLSDYVVNTIKKKLIVNTGMAIGEHLLKSLGTGLAANITGTALKGAILSIGAEALKGTVRGGLISLLTMPLMGNRPPPETVWLDLLHDHPEILINPEWMRLAKVQDHPWMAHCAAVLREAERIEKVLVLNLKNEETAFIKSVTSISTLKEFKLEPKKERGPDLDLYPRAVIDNTYVKKPLIISDPVPFWAKKK